MMQEAIKLIQENPEILVFLSLGIGYLIGKIKVKGFGLGSTASVLLVAMVLGQITIEVPSLLKNISFALFAFCIGYQVGPQFFGSLRKEGLNYLWIALVVALVGLVTVIILGKALHFDKGTTAGLFAGAMTQSAVIGTAQGAVDSLSISGADKAVLNGNIAVAYAITYIFGTIGVIIFFKLLPGSLRLNLKKEARKLEEKMGGASDLSKNPALFSWSQQVGLRAYTATSKAIIGKSAAEVERLFSVRITIDRIERNGKMFDATADTQIEAADILVITGNFKGLLEGANIIGYEVDSSEFAEMVGESLDICILNPIMTGKPLSELAKIPEILDAGRGVFLRGATRQGRALPITLGTVLNKCDVVKLVGTKADVERAAQLLGYPMRPTSATDLIMVGVGCVLGTLLGTLAVTIGGVPLTLGVGGGVLVAGLIFGWLRSVHPTFGQIPEGGQWILNDLGLNLFIACIGLSSAKQALQAMQTNGLTIFGAGVVLAFVPIIAGVLFGKYLLRMNPVLLLGALTGARVIPPALNTLQEDAESSMLTLGFAAPFAFANVFLTIMGSVIINLM
ncbi:MAG: aspartate-alanine antiporter [Candidatus Omnitrophica bacterium]|nr:aspartate-alanine antiporter [Candidatus Omnitrophota bacterium]